MQFWLYGWYHLLEVSLVSKLNQTTLYKRVFLAHHYWTRIDVPIGVDSPYQVNAIFIKTSCRADCCSFVCFLSTISNLCGRHSGWLEKIKEGGITTIIEFGHTNLAEGFMRYRQQELKQHTFSCVSLCHGLFSFLGLIVWYPTSH